MPEPIARLAAGRPLAPVWVNAIGGKTFRVGGTRADSADEYLKWVPALPAWIGAEAERLAWAGRWLRVPEVVDHGADEDGAWLVTRALPGWSAVDPRWRDEPRTAAWPSARGSARCTTRSRWPSAPSSWSSRDRADRGRAAAADPARLGPARDRPAVVCHGDACTPNTLSGTTGAGPATSTSGRSGSPTGWADLAVATMALGWNLGPGWEPLFHGAYGLSRPTRNAPPGTARCGTWATTGSSATAPQRRPQRRGPQRRRPQQRRGRRG